LDVGVAREGREMTGVLDRIFILLLGLNVPRLDWLEEEIKLEIGSCWFVIEVELLPAGEIEL
jgi:hypothetical protein